MRKLKLALDDLIVDAFQTGQPMEERGTVGGHIMTDGSCPNTVNSLSCNATSIYCCPRTEYTGYCCS
ncbi:MAG TPA: hypothetical protein VHG08_08170 [Longimicrobium sp.]|nr:hypothetical protein [Longimicrobium sp.]